MTFKIDERFLWGVIASLIALAIGWTLGIGASTGWTEVTAAWVQAVGSVAAILASIRIASRQSHAARDGEARAQREVETTAAAMIAYAAFRTRLAFKDAKVAVRDGRKTNRALRQRLLQFIEQIDAVDALRLRNPELTHMLLVARDRMRLADEQLDYLERLAVGHRDEVDDQVSAALEELKRHTANAAKYEALVRERWNPPVFKPI
jgi:hypothetical protein